MKSKILGIVTVLCVLLGIATMPISAQENISIGDYVEMGTYYGKPILWRCVDIDENGPLMLSDKIICIKAFDAPGKNTEFSHGRGYYQDGVQGYYRQTYGSNYWGDSNIRDWLNSDASVGNVVWSCGNPPDKAHVWNGKNAYDQEAGFLSNFNPSEKAAIKTVTQKQILDGYEYSDKENVINPDYHTMGYDISDVLQNYDTAFSEYVTDKMFLIDVKQLYNIYMNGDILGSNYYLGKLTAEAVEHDESGSNSQAGDGKWCWLRTPAAYNYYGYFVSALDRYISTSSKVNGTYPCSDGGIRPAFYLNTEVVLFESGSGTEADPYIVFYENEQEEPETQIVLGDLNDDGKVTAVDNVILARYLAGWIGYEKLPYKK